MNSIKEEIAETTEDLEMSPPEPGQRATNEVPLFARFLEKSLRVKTHLKAGMFKWCTIERGGH